MEGPILGGAFFRNYGKMKLSRVSFFESTRKKKLPSQIASSSSNFEVSIIHFEAAFWPIKKAVATSKQSRDAVRHSTDPVLCPYSK